MIKLENIVVKFNKNKILNDLNCQINKQDFITIVGTNGSGKSTLLNTIAGKIIPSSGKIFFDNIEITKSTEVERAPLIGRLFQNTYLSCIKSMSVKENLAIAAIKGKNIRLKNAMTNFPQKQINDISSLLEINLKKLLDKKMADLSGGQRQTISLIMTTLVPPKILLLDEPTAALDPASATKLLKFATQFIKTHKITSLLITHDPHIALALGNKLWVIDNGKIIKEFNQKQKKELSPQELIGHIDYEKISQLN